MDKLLSLIVILCISFSTQVFAQCIDGDCWDGTGSFVYKSGAKYVGMFNNGKIHGEGILYFSNGNKYVGEWENYYRQGNGKLTYKNGESYTGQFKASKFNGEGEFIYSNGDRYSGYWQNDLAEGQGTYFFQDGDRYEGAFEKGQFSGKGTMFYKTGAYYEGNWKNNKKEGNGIFVNSSGKETVGNWVNGDLMDARDYDATNHQSDVVEAPSPSNNKLRNCNQDFCNSGKGQFTYGDGSRYVGAFVNGVPEGDGTCFYANGDKYVGGWKNHSPDGKGIMYYRYGRVLGAIWKDGTVHQTVHDAGDDIVEEYVEVDEDKDVKIWSVVVGVGRYQHMPVLKYTDDDAYQIYAFFKSPEGGALPDNQIRVLIDEDATRQNIIRAMRQVFLQADDNDVIVFYFSGHGYDGSFIPSDYDGYSNLLYHADIRKVLEESKAKHKICLADACHSGSSAYNGLAARAPYEGKLKKFYEAFEASTGGIALLMSSKKEEYSLEDQGLRQGIFSHYLIRGLKGEGDSNGDQIITISELYDFVYTNVRSYTANVQTPTLSGEHDINMPISFVR